MWKAGANWWYYDTKAMLLLYRVLQYLCNTAEIESVLPYMEIKVCTHLFSLRKLFVTF